MSVVLRHDSSFVFLLFGVFFVCLVPSLLIRLLLDVNFVLFGCSFCAVQLDSSGSLVRVTSRGNSMSSISAGVGPELMPWRRLKAFNQPSDFLKSSIPRDRAISSACVLILGPERDYI